MNTTLALLTCGLLTLGAARADITHDEASNDRAERLVRIVTSFDKEQSEVVMVIARGDVQMQLAGITTIRADETTLVFDYVNEGKTMQAAVESSDVLVVMERPRS